MKTTTSILVWIACGVLFCGVSDGSVIISPTDLNGTVIPTTTVHQHIGTKPSSQAITAQLLLASSDTICTQHPFLPETVTIVPNSTVVVVIDLVEDYFKSLNGQQEMMLCAQELGAVGVIMNYHNILVPGFTLYFNQDIHNKLSIPALNSADPDFTDVFAALIAGKEVLISFEEDTNEWKEMWNSVMFAAFWQGILPLINLIGILSSGYSLLTHIAEHRAAASRPNKVFSAFVRQRSSQKLMLVGCLFELSGFLIRFTYCVVSPLYSNDILPYAGHVFMINLTVPLEVSSALISATLFMRWGAFGKLKRAQIIERAILTFAFCFATPLQVSVALMGYYRVTALTTMIIINIGMMLIITGTTSILFITYGTFFVTRLNHKVGDDSKLSSKRLRALSKAVRWIVLSGVMQLVVLLGTAAAFNVAFFYHPFGFNVCYLTIYIGLSLQASTQIMAFRRPVHPLKSKLSKTRSTMVLAIGKAKQVLKVPTAAERYVTRYTKNGPKPAQVIMPTVSSMSDNALMERRRSQRTRPIHLMQQGGTTVGDLAAARQTELAPMGLSKDMRGSFNNKLRPHPLQQQQRLSRNSSTGSSPVVKNAPLKPAPHNHTISRGTVLEATTTPDPAVFNNLMNGKPSEANADFFSPTDTEKSTSTTAAPVVTQPVPEHSLLPTVQSCDSSGLPRRGLLPGKSWSEKRKPSLASITRSRNEGVSTNSARRRAENHNNETMHTSLLTSAAHCDDDDDDDDPGDDGWSCGSPDIFPSYLSAPAVLMTHEEHSDSDDSLAGKF